MKKIINNEIVDLNSEELAQIETDIAKDILDEKTRKDAEADKETKKASGKQKLKDLGLDDDEIQALMGA
jgi:hypothetical protein